MSLYSKLFAITISFVFGQIYVVQKRIKKKILQAYLRLSGRLENRMGS